MMPCVRVGCMLLFIASRAYSVAVKPWKSQLKLYTVWVVLVCWYVISLFILWVLCSCTLVIPQLVVLFLYAFCSMEARILFCYIWRWTVYFKLVIKFPPWSSHISDNNCNEEEGMITDIFYVCDCYDRECHWCKLF